MTDEINIESLNDENCFKVLTLFTELLRHKGNPSALCLLADNPGGIVIGAEGPIERIIYALVTGLHHVLNAYKEQGNENLFEKVPELKKIYKILTALVTRRNQSNSQSIH